MSISRSKARISLLVFPNAARNEALSFTDGALRVRVAAPPAKGKANRELIAFLGRLLDVGKGSVNITKGHTSRNKLVTIDGLSQEEVIRRLSHKF